MQLPPEIFRAYDIRGIVGQTLTVETVYAIGQALGTQVHAAGETQMVIARDGRMSGPVLLEALAAGITATGIDVVSLGQVPTPLLYFATYHLQIPSGVMITGSHNPPDYNGLKMMMHGQAIYGEQIQAICHQIQQGKMAVGQGTVREVNIVDDYIQIICKRIQLQRPLKLVVDCGNGVAGDVAPKLYEALGCTVVPMFCEVDGRFPNHHPDPGDPNNLSDLIAQLKDEQGELGFAFDGDGDRLGVIAGNGEIIWPDRLLILLAKAVLACEPEATIIYDVKSSKHVANAIRQAGGHPLMWKTGHSLIKAKMRETKAALAGEMSGHIFFKQGWYGFDDALYAGARLLEILSQSELANEVIFADLPNSINTPEIPISVTEENKFQIMTHLARDGDFNGATDIITVDGLRVEYTDGWGLIRPSNTSPKLITRFEADSKGALERIQQSLRHELIKVAPELEIPF